MPGVIAEWRERRYGSYLVAQYGPDVVVVAEQVSSV